MAPFAYHITYVLDWKGKVEETSCVFHYQNPVPATQSGHEDLLDQIVELFRGMLTSHSQVTRGRVHGPTNGSKADDIMRVVKDYTGKGGTLGAPNTAAELAVVVSCLLGRGPKGGKRILRKYIHSANLPGAAGGDAQTRGAAALTASQKSAFATPMNSLKNMTVGGQLVPICAPNGDTLPLGSNFVTSDFLSTRQFRRRGKRPVSLANPQP